MKINKSYLFALALIGLLQQCVLWWYCVTGSAEVSGKKSAPHGQRSSFLPAIYHQKLRLCSNAAV